MQTKPKSNAQVLEEIKQSFSKWNRENHKGGCSAALKRLAIAAVESGHSASEVGRAAGVSGQSITNWRKREKSIAAPTELKLSAVEPVPSAGDSPLLRIYFRSGASVEIPPSHFTAQLVAILNSGAE